nr:response regulator [Thermoanaerobacterales bacterium]
MTTNPSSPPARVRRGHVLVVEDDAATARYLVLALQRAGYTAASVGDAVAAERYLADNDCDALLVDIGLPGPSGFELVRELKEARPTLPVALVTAYANMDVAVRALRSEVDDFLAKPIEPPDLVEAVDRLVARGRAAEAGSQRVLAVGAHPDDVAVAVGGTLLRHRFEGDEVAVLSLTGGDGGPGAEAAARAAELLDAQLFLFDLPVGEVTDGEPAVGLVAGVIDELVPSVVYTHSLNDQRADHRRAHHATLAAARRIPTVCCYEGPSATVDFRPVRFVPIDPFVDAKLEVVAAAVGVGDGSPDQELVRATGRYWGRFGGARYCEPLEVAWDTSGRAAESAAAAVAPVTG